RLLQKNPPVSGRPGHRPRGRTWGRERSSVIVRIGSHQIGTAISFPTGPGGLEMRRREFIAGLAGAATWPIAAQAQQAGARRRIGVLMAFDETSPGAKLWLSGFTRGLSEAGWTDGRNVQIDVRWAAGSVDRIRMFAKELVDLKPDVILTHTTPVTAALQR